MERAAAHALDRQPQVGEVVLFDRPGHGRVERREIEFRTGRLGLGLELHADRVQRRGIVGADPMFGETLEIEVQQLTLVFSRFHLMILKRRPRAEAKGGGDVERLGSVKFQTPLQGNGGRKAFGLQLTWPA